MHHALFISEVAREMCGALGILDPSTLPAVARTCRALQDPALDELWRDLYSIHPFVHLLTQEGHQCLTWQKWTTLRKYSARTRLLHMCMIEDLPYSGRFSYLSNPPDPDLFFPNLRAVVWYPDNHLEILPFFRLLCGPSLSSLVAEFATDPTSLSTLASLGTLCPNITDISISAASTTLSDDLANALSASICCWNDLRHVSCDNLAVRAMEHLGQVKNLESLTACVPTHMSSNYPRQSSFSQLRCLHLYAGLLSTATSCLRGLHLALTELRLDLFDAEGVLPNPSGLSELFATLVEACSHVCLSKFYLCVIHPHLSFPNFVATIFDVRSLLSFSYLHVVSLDGFTTFSFTDDDIAELASAWPHVEELALSTYVHHPIVSLPTLRSLFHLARSCPKLRALSLVVDTTDVATPSVRMAGRDVRSDVLHSLCLGNSPIKSPVAVARTLHTLYPALKYVDLSVWNREPLSRHAQRDRYEFSWGTVNIELSDIWQTSAFKACR